MLPSCGIRFERLAGGRPILAPNTNPWEDGFTHNAAAVRLGPEDDELLCKLCGPDVPAEGAVAVLYRAQPRTSPGFPAPRSSVGLALFTPGFELIRRYPEPVLLPTDDPLGYDCNGAEDPRVTRMGDLFCMVYCGYTIFPSGKCEMQVCLAVSRDLLHWEKLGPARGEVNALPNKDGVLLPGTIVGKHVLLHRPMSGPHQEFAIELAVADSLEGEWHNLGPILRSSCPPECEMSWLGAGPPPIPLGNQRYLMVFHTGHRLASGDRQYNADAAILDFRRLTSGRPSAIVTSVVERILVPETPYELDSPYFHEDRLHCVFPCGNYVEGDFLTLVYGGGDAYVLAARAKMSEVLERLAAVQGRP